MFLYILWLSFFVSSAQINVPLLPGIETHEIDLKNIPQKFVYLNEGKQVIACSSTKTPIVLKFFKRNILEYPWYLKLPLPKQWVRKKKTRIASRKWLYPQGYFLALKYLKDETGVLCVHQKLSDASFPTVEIRSNFNTMKLNLNEIPFVLQKRADQPFIDTLKRSVGLKSFENLIDQFIQFHQKRINLLIADDDKDILHNYYLLNGLIQYIDPAGFYYEPDLALYHRKNEEWYRATHRLRRWISNHAPKFLNSFDEKVSKASSL